MSTWWDVLLAWELTSAQSLESYYSQLTNGYHKLRGRFTRLCLHIARFCYVSTMHCLDTMGTRHRMPNDGCLPPSQKEIDTPSLDQCFGIGEDFIFESAQPRHGTRVGHNDTRQTKDAVFFSTGSIFDIDRMFRVSQPIKSTPHSNAGASKPQWTLSKWMNSALSCSPA